MHNKIAQFTLTSKKSPNFGNIFIAQPESAIEKLSGKLFVLVEINSKSKSGNKVVNFLIDNINKNYYQNEKIILREKISTLKVEHIFEAALTKTNKQFLKYLEDEKIKIPLEKINIATGIIYNNFIHFANSGKNKLQLIHKNKTGNFIISNIAKQIIGKESDTKLFSNVISGQIPNNASFIISNEALLEYISDKQLIKILNTLPPVSAATQIKNHLLSINSYISFYSIIVKNTLLDQEENKEEITHTPSTAYESVIDLNKTENNTENLLSPSCLNVLKKISLFLSTTFSKNKSQNKNIYIKDRIFVQKKNSIIFKKIFNTIKNIILILLNISFYIFRFIVDKNNLTKIKSKIKNLKILLTTLKVRNKILLIISILLIILFAVNSYHIKKENKKQARVEEYNNISSLIEQKQNQVDAKLLYSNDNGAKALFDEVNQLISELPTDTKKQKEQHDKFKEKNDLHLEKIRRITRIEDTQKIADFINLNDTATPEEIIFIPTNQQGQIYVSDPLNKSIYYVDIKDKTVTPITAPNTISNLSSPIKTNKNNIYFLNEKNILELNTLTDEITKIDINNTDLQEINTAAIYNNRIYLLSKDGKILRHNRNGHSLSSPYSWIQDSSPDIKDNISISIDGNIYTLSRTGIVTKFSKGLKTDFAIETVDPPLTTPTKIHASAELDYIYILEPIERRLVVFNKKGEFLMQYQFANLDNIKDFDINEEDKTIYVLNGTSLYSSSALHLTQNP